MVATRSAGNVLRCPYKYPVVASLAASVACNNEKLHTETSNHRENCECTSQSLSKNQATDQMQRVYHPVFSNQHDPGFILQQCEKSLISTADETVRLDVTSRVLEGIFTVLKSCSCHVLLKMCLTRGPYCNGSCFDKKKKKRSEGEAMF